MRMKPKYTTLSRKQEDNRKSEITFVKSVV